MNPYIGQQLGSYQILEQIGQGGMATIFKAYQASMDRYVAIKILPGHFTNDETFLARFNQEARTLARLEHPHILPVHDYGEQEGITFLVMRYIEAGTLKDLIAQHGPLDLQEAARLLDQIGRALGYAHSQGVIHRDIKPTNVMIDKRGDAFLTDFGIAKLVAGTSQFTATGAIIGTPAYMSPEQGLAETVDGRSDIYSLGVVLYEMVTGRVPFEAETPLAVLLKHIHDPLPPPRHLMPDLPEVMERVILKAMAKSPKDRFQTTDEMLDAVQRAVAGIPGEVSLSPRPDPPYARARDVSTVAEPVIDAPAPAPAPESMVTVPTRKISLALVFGGAAALVVLLLAAVFLILPDRSGGEAKEAPTQPAIAAADAAMQRTLVLQQGNRPDPSYVGNADAILRSDFADINVGGEEHLEVFFGDGVGHSLMRWDLSSLPGGITVNAASLELFHNEGEAEQDMELALHLVTRDWDEGASAAGFFPPAGYVADGATWLAASADVPWAAPGGDYDSVTDYGYGPNGIVGQITLPSEIGQDWIRIDVTPAIQTWIEARAPNYGLLLRPVRGGGYHYFRSRDHAVIELRPRLVVTYTEGQTGTDVASGVRLPAPGWTGYTSGNDVNSLVRHGDYLWAGGSGGLVRWDLNDESYVKFGVADGLASNQVNDLLVDVDGNLWVATEEGLNRWDGETWLTFDRADGLDGDEVETLLLDNDGALWAGTADGDRGLNIYDGIDWRPPPISGLPGEYNAVHLLAMERNFGLWAALLDGGLAYYDGLSWRLFTSDDGLSSDYVQALFLTDADELWVAFDAGVMRRDSASGEWQAVPQLEEKTISAIIQARDGSYWFGGEGGAVRYSEKVGDWELFEPRPGVLPNQPIATIVEDERGIWMGTSGGGLVLYDGQSWQSRVTDDGLGGNEIFAIRQDGDGALWFTHPGSGLSRYNPLDDTWQAFGAESGALDWPYEPGVDRDGHLWIGGDEHLRWYDGKTWQRVESEQLAGVGTVFGIRFGPDGAAWYRTDDGLIRHSPASDEWRTFTANDHPVLEHVGVVYVTRDGAVWAGGDNGLVLLEESGWSPSSATGDKPERAVTAIAEAPDHSLWVIADGELYQLDGGRWRHFARPDSGWIKELAISPDGTVWVGADGLARFDPASDTWQVFYTEDGLIDNSVTAVHVTPEGIVWIGTVGGISRFVPEK